MKKEKDQAPKEKDCWHPVQHIKNPGKTVSTQEVKKAVSELNPDTGTRDRG